MKTNILLSVLVAITLPSVSNSAEFDLKLAHIYSPEHSYNIGAEYMAKKVFERTNGAIKIEIYPAGQLGDEKAMADSIRRGTIDISFVGPGEISKRYPAFSIIEAPFIFRNYEHGRKILDSDRMKPLFEEMQIKTRSKLLGITYYGARQITSNKPIETASDLKGMKLRTPDMPIYFDTVKALGAQPTPMSLSEVYLSLSQGVVDGQENPIPTIFDQKYYEVQKYITMTNHIMAFTPILMAEKSWNKLPHEYQAIVEEVALDAQELIDSSTLKIEQEKMSIMEQSGVTFIYPESSTFQEMMSSVIDKYSSIWGEGKYKEYSSL